ncbi:hypothetical protein C5167_005838 [Papaver somniferum]|uniref:Uncharacterized protein n=1 Tax=Papaver somniferum TaxID=3469 RepID=A0A4Y7JDC3_PAPSO|nr:hypothetical protein C5167_005838 [Papaver somniferum]
MVSLSPVTHLWDLVEPNGDPMESKMHKFCMRLLKQERKLMLRSGGLKIWFGRCSVYLGWPYEQGVGVLVKSFNEQRMKENLVIFDWELAESDLLLEVSLESA